MNYSIEAIRASCPVASGQEAAKAFIPVISVDEYDPSVGQAECQVPAEWILNAHTFGCRNVTAVSSSGCPLRDGPSKIAMIDK